MQRLKIRHIVAAGALALIATVPLAACGADSVSPLPVQAAEAEPTAIASPTTTITPSAESPPAVANPPAGLKPAQTKTVKASPPRPTSTRPVSTCLGAVRKDLDLHNNELALVGPMCFHTGGVLRLQGIGPGLVTWTPQSLVSHNYAGGVVDLTFIRPGTVTVSIPQDGQTYTITVVVRK